MSRRPEASPAQPAMAQHEHPRPRGRVQQPLRGGAVLEDARLDLDARLSGTGPGHSLVQQGARTRPRLPGLAPAPGRRMVRAAHVDHAQRRAPGGGEVGCHIDRLPRGLRAVVGDEDRPRPVLVGADDRDGAARVMQQPPAHGAQQRAEHRAEAAGADDEQIRPGGRLLEHLARHAGDELRGDGHIGVLHRDTLGDVVEEAAGLIAGPGRVEHGDAGDALPQQRPGPGVQQADPDAGVPGELGGPAHGRHGGAGVVVSHQDAPSGWFHLRHLPVRP